MIESKNIVFFVINRHYKDELDWCADRDIGSSSFAECVGNIGWASPEHNFVIVPRYMNCEDFRQNELEVKGISDSIYAIGQLLKLKMLHDVKINKLIEDMIPWYIVLNKDELLTFPTKTEGQFLEMDKDYIVKGNKTSIKWQWDTHMFARGRVEAIEVAHKILHIIPNQHIVYRDYVPLQRLGTGLNNLPIVNEWRFFFLGNKLIDYGFYWANEEDLEPTLTPSQLSLLPATAYKAAKLLTEAWGEHIFVSIDLAFDETGKCWVVEVNDGHNSGLSTIPPERFYKNLINAIEEMEL